MMKKSKREVARDRRTILNRSFPAADRSFPTADRSFPTAQRSVPTANRSFATAAVLILLLWLVNSCVTTSKTAYFQDIPDSPSPVDRVEIDDYRIQPFDNLFIRVSSPDPTWSEIFNAMPMGGGGNMGASAQSVDLVSYTVKKDGTVEIPYLGSIEVAGKTVAETKTIMEEAIAGYASDAAITVKLVNNYVSVLGEVNTPGRYPIFKEQMNIFQAISMAGDLSVYGNRQSVRIIRPGPEGTVIREFDLRDKQIVDSEFFYVMPNDVIYVEPIRGKFFGLSQFPYTVVLSTITTFLLVLNFLNN